MQKKSIIKSIFFPRKSTIPQDEKDSLIKVDKEIHIGIRRFI